MPTTVITVKNVGPSKKYPDKFGWVLDENETFWNVTRKQADSITIGAQYTITHHVNNKGYQQVDAVQPANATPPTPHPRITTGQQLTGAPTPIAPSERERWIEAQCLYKANIAAGAPKGAQHYYECRVAVEQAHAMWEQFGAKPPAFDGVPNEDPGFGLEETF